MFDFKTLNQDNAAEAQPEQRREKGDLSVLLGATFHIDSFRFHDSNRGYGKYATFTVRERPSLLFFATKPITKALREIHNADAADELVNQDCRLEQRVIQFDDHEATTYALVF